MRDLRDASVEALARLKRLRYQHAVTHGVIEQIATVARELGRDPVSIDHPGYQSTYGPKFRWVHGDIRLYVDDYGHYMTVHDGDKQVCSTHTCDKFFVPGAWVDTVLGFYPTVAARVAARKERRAQDERQRLIEQLGG